MPFPGVHAPALRRRRRVVRRLLPPPLAGGHMPTVHFPAWLLLPMHRNFMGKIGAEEESEDGNLLRLFRFIFSRFLATGRRGEGWPSRVRRPGSEPLGGHLAPSLTSSRLSPVSGFTARHLRPRGLSQPPRGDAGARERAGPRGFRRTRYVKQPRAQGRGRAHAPEQGDPHVPSVSVGPAPSADLGASASASASSPAPSQRLEAQGGGLFGATCF